MSNITKHVAEDGRVSYNIRCGAGYGVDGRQRRRSMTWTPPSDMSPKRADKEAAEVARKFEDTLRAGLSEDGGIRFQAFVESVWLPQYAEKQLKKQSLAGYKQLFPLTFSAIGHIPLRALRTGHLNQFYANLQEQGVRRDGRYRCRRDIRAMVNKLSVGRLAFCRSAGVSSQVFKAAARGDLVSAASANKLSAALGVKTAELWDVVYNGDGTLASNTIRHYHRFISSVLSKAVRWGYIPFNPAANAELPRLVPQEASYLDAGDARRLLELLQAEPVCWRTAITFDLLSGLRRGELLGLRWRDVDWDAETVSVVQSVSYTSEAGTYVDVPKNKTSVRPLKLSHSAFSMLSAYRAWQDDCRAICGDAWQGIDDRIFTMEDGSPMLPNSLSQWFHKFVRRSGLPPVHVHSLRHTYASLMIADGTPLVVVSRRLGHAQVSTTSNIYSHLIASADEKASQVGEAFADIIPMPEPKSSVPSA